MTHVPLRWLEHRIPPPLVALLIGGAMWGTARLGPLAELSLTVRLGLAAAIGLVGVAFNVAGMAAFRRARTTLNPMNPDQASVLVTTGVYGITRNPMYVGGAFLLVSWAVYLSSPWALLGPPLFLAYVTRLQIVPEERALSARFGGPYDSYRARVRRWL